MMDNWLKSYKLNEIKRKWLQVVAPKIYRRGILWQSKIRKL